MKLLVLALVVAVASAEYSLSWFPQPGGPSGRIINGQNAAAGQAPFICSLRLVPIVTPSHMCGSSILRENWILTAAHCITEVPNIGTLNIACGMTNFNTDTGSQQVRPFHRVNDVTIHEDYVPGGAVGPDDIAVIRLVTALTFNAVVQPVRQMTSGVVSIGLCRLFGWGATSTSPIAPLPTHLQTAEKDLLTIQECEARLRAINPTFGDPLADTNICAARGNISACGGDSGGPLVVYENGEAVQVGVVSWGISPCGSINGVPSVYVRSSAYIEWMDAIMG